LSGKTENDDSGEPWPIVVPGIPKPVPSNRVGEYVNHEFWYYYEFYTRCKSAGPPFPAGWTEWPPWIPQLLAAFDPVLESKRRLADMEFQAALHGMRMK
jgi:hypothetical protein